MSELLIRVNFSIEEIIDAASRLAALPGFIWLDSTQDYNQAYSYMTWNPLAELETQSGNVISQKYHSPLCEPEAKSLEEIIETISKKYQQRSEHPGFCGGWISLLSYDEAIELEGLNSRHAKEPSYYNFYSFVVILDHKANQVILSIPQELANSKNSPQVIVLTISSCLSSSQAKASLQVSGLTAEISAAEYTVANKQVLDEIRAGNVYQINHSYRIRAAYHGDLFLLYQHLRSSNPAPYSAYVGFSKVTVLSCSPEILLKKTQTTLLTKPIKGTRPRGKTQQQDELFRQELLGSKKESSELTMIVDLERNDLSKIAKPGSVKVQSLGRIEKYANVQHLVAEVEAEVQENVSPIQILRAISPGGSITGAPKKSALTIIDRYEISNRGYYTGSLGFISLNGDMSFNILIRSIFAANNSLYLGTGGGIVADSISSMEYQETLDKSALLIQALNKFS